MKTEMKPKVFITRRIPEEAFQIVAEHCEIDIWDEEERPVPRGVLVEAVSSIDGLFCLLTDRVDEELLNAAPRLRIVANMAVGYDNIDVKACARRGVMVTNTPGVLTETTADLAFGLLLAVARRIPEAERKLLEGGWKTWSPMFMAGRDVYGATLGIIGMGRIGQAMARRARGFSMKVLYWSRNRDAQVEEELGVEYRSLYDLLRESDFVTLHVPLNSDTRGLIGEREISLMKPTAVLINTARGPIVDRDALYRALVSGRIWGAGLDVYDVEPADPSDPLLNLDNVVALPHIGSATVETRTRMAVMAAENLVAGLSGRIPPNLVEA